MTDRTCPDCAHRAVTLPNFPCGDCTNGSDGALRNHWASIVAPVSCQCGVRLAAGCPGAREQGCDLGANEAHVEVVQMVPTGIEAEVCADIARRQALGVAKYGQTVAENPLTHEQWLQHAYEECLDMAVYLKRAKTRAAGWTFEVEGDTVLVTNPGGEAYVAHESSAMKSSRMLYALAKALS